MTHKQRILGMLRRGDVCGDTLLELHMPRYAARVHELKADGYQIISRRCKQHTWHTSPVVEYILVREPSQWRKE